MAAIVAAVAAVAGTAVSVAGQISAAEAQKEALEKEAQNKNLQANELLQRQSINEGILRERSVEIQKGYESSFASTGRAGGGLGGVLKIRRDLERDIMLQQREANFKAFQIRSGAEADMRLGSDVAKAGLLGAIGTSFQGAYKLADLYRGKDDSVGVSGAKGRG